jgi:hypothetical protein
LFAELFCGPAAADAGADDDGIVLVHRLNLRKLRLPCREAEQFFSQG